MKHALIALALLSQTNAFANTTTLQAEREQVTKQYMQDLQQANYQHITQLFEKNGYVISTSKGKVNAKEFFYAFLPNIVTATTKYHQFFNNANDENRMSARFNFTFKLKDGEVGEGEYVDEFVFVAHSSKLAAVYMFENLHYHIKE